MISELLQCYYAHSLEVHLQWFKFPSLRDGVMSVKWKCRAMFWGGRWSCMWCRRSKSGTRA